MAPVDLVVKAVPLADDFAVHEEGELSLVEIQPHAYDVTSFELVVKK